MNASLALSLNLPFPVIPRPGGPTVLIDEKMVGSGVTVTLWRHKHKSWDASGEFRHEFFVSVEPAGTGEMIFIGNGAHDLESAVVVYNRCSDSIG